MPSSSAPTIYFPGILLLTTNEMMSDALTSLSSAQYTISLHTNTSFQEMMSWLVRAAATCTSGTYKSTLSSPSDARILKRELYRSEFMNIGHLEVGSAVAFIPTSARLDDHLQLSYKMSSALSTIHNRVAFNKVPSQ